LGTLLFDRAFARALSESPDTLMEALAIAVERGDWAQAQRIDDMVRFAVAVGTNAVAATRIRRERN
jgi:phage terminase large subunit-like protein